MGASLFGNHGSVSSSSPCHRQQLDWLSEVEYIVPCGHRLSQLWGLRSRAQVRQVWMGREGGQPQDRQQPGPSAVQSVPASGFSSEPLEEATIICLGLCSV